MRGRFLQALSVVGLLHVAVPARADVDTAREYFAEGVKRFQKSDYEGARRLFLDADREHHSPVIDYNLGLAEERLGRPQAAVDAYERYLAEAGEDGEYAQAAAVAVAQVKARSGRLQIASNPPGGRIFINGLPVRERAPTLVLVPAGHHLVVIEGDDYRVTADVDVDVGQKKSVVLQRPNKPLDAGGGAGDPPHSRSQLEGLVWGGSFQVVPYAFLPRSSKSTGLTQDGATGIFVGVSLEAAFAFTSRAVVGLRAFGSVGSECKGVFDSHVAAAGPMLAIRPFDNWWFTAGLHGGNGETCRSDDPTAIRKYSTDIVFSPMFDVSYAVTSRHYGQWLVSVGLGYFFATPSNDNRLIYAPVGFGPRFF